MSISKFGRLSFTRKNETVERRSVKELVSLLTEKELVIIDLRRKLRDLGENQSLSIRELRRERDELRNKNATLVGELAEISRKKSVTSPVPPR